MPQYRRLRYHRRSSDHDRWLDELGLFRKHIINDPNSLFRIVSENVFNTQSYHEKVRKDCVSYLATYETKFKTLVRTPFVKYLKELSNQTTHGSFTEVTVMSHLYKHDFIILHNDKGPRTNIFNGYGNTIYLLFVKETKHFDALFSKEYIQNVSFCQSLAYGLLYEGVFQMTGVQYAVQKMLYNEASSNMQHKSENMEKRKRHRDNYLLQTIDQLSTGIIQYPFNDRDIDFLCDDMQKYLNRRDNFSFRLYSQDDDLITISKKNAKYLVDNKILPFSYKTAKALDPNTYKNLELDSWSEAKRDEQSILQYCDGLSLRVGVKCLCYLDSNNKIMYHCHIQNMEPNNGPCVVFIEELGEKRTVKLEQLKSLPAEEAKPWYAPNKRGLNKYAALAHVLRHLGYLNQTNNLQKSSQKVKKSEGFRQELVTIPEERSLNIDGRINLTKKKLENSPIEDSNNNIIWDSEPIKSYPNSKQDKQHTMQYLEKYTKVDYYNFQPPQLHFVAMPMVVEQNSSASAENTISRNEREGPTPNRQMTYFAEEIHVSIPISNGSDINPSPILISHTHTPGSTSSINSFSGQNPMLYGNGGSSGPPMCQYPVYCMPSMAHPPPFLPRLPPGVNYTVQRSVNANGSDLPFHDVSTLRFFFNLGVDAMFGGGGAWPGPPQASPHVPRQYCSSPEQLALELQQNLNIEDPQQRDQNKTDNSSGNKRGMQKNNGRNFDNSNRGGRGGSHASRIKRYDTPAYWKNGQGDNRNRGGSNNRNGAPRNNSEHHQDSDLSRESPQNKDQAPRGNPSPPQNSLENVPLVAYPTPPPPPPPLLRVPCYAGEESASFVPQYYYGPPEDDYAALRSMPPYAAYPGYLGTPQPMYYPPPAGYGDFIPYVTPDSENRPK